MKRLLCEEKVLIPEGCEVNISNKILTIKGKRDTSVRDFSRFMFWFEVLDGHISIRLWNGKKRERSKLITCASVIRNAIKGCMHGYAYTLKVVCKHFPMIVEIEDEGRAVAVKNFLGQKSTKNYRMAGNARARLGAEKDTIVIEGSSLEEVSQSAGTIQEDCQAKKIDSRKFLDGIYVLKKEVIAA